MQGVKFSYLQDPVTSKLKYDGSSGVGLGIPGSGIVPSDAKNLFGPNEYGVLLFPFSIGSHEEDPYVTQNMYTAIAKVPDIGVHTAYGTFARTPLYTYLRLYPGGFEMLTVTTSGVSIRHFAAGNVAVGQPVLNQFTDRSTMIPGASVLTYLFDDDISASQQVLHYASQGSLKFQTVISLVSHLKVMGSSVAFDRTVSYAGQLTPVDIYPFGELYGEAARVQSADLATSQAEIVVKNTLGGLKYVVR